ncbi:hypothetical protein LSCM1_01483 [Leishmania martiniquensis]|uniref:Uncharacterized protein n=1 Tax=Leishmania martiniquensis TaxID=1580590 RepID=A0A836GFV9_9TRYP|nr:hypothetical protein LSCM1_01483 [Leishmania martiniquensis]
MDCAVPPFEASHASLCPDTPNSLMKVTPVWAITAPSDPCPTAISQASGETLSAFAGGSATTKPAAHTAHALSKKPPFSTISAIRRFVCRSSIMQPFMAERAVKEKVILPPPIYYLYPLVGEAQHSPSQRADHFAACGDSRPEAEKVKICQPCGDVFRFTWTTKEVKAMQMRQREHLRRQRRSPHAPALVRLEELSPNLLNDAYMGQRGKASTAISDAAARTTHCDVAEALSGLCTRAIPQAEYIHSVFQYRMNVLQKRIDAVPTGVVVPAIVQATTALRNRPESRRGERFPKKTKGTATSEKAASPMEVPTVTFPHPGLPFTYQDLAQDPLHLTPPQRAERRAALLHERTLSEEVYGQPVPYS